MHSCNQCCSGRAINITHSESVSVAFGIQHAMHICHIILSSVACPSPQYFSTLSHKWHDFWKKVIRHKICFDFSLQLLSEKFPIRRRTEQDMIINVNWSSGRVPIILVRFPWNSAQWESGCSMLTGRHDEAN